MTSAQITPIQRDTAPIDTRAIQDLAIQASRRIAITAQTNQDNQVPGPTKGRSMHERAAAAEARGDAEDTQHAPTKSPLNKYTPGNEMPRVQDAFPAAAIANIDPTVLDAWFNNEGMKALLIPFEDQARDQDLQSDVGYKLLTAVEEITASPIVAIAPPVQSSTVTKFKQIPITFLASHLTDAEYETLLSRHVWSSEAITFCIIPTDPPCPDFFFTIRGLATLDENRILGMVYQVWNDNESRLYIANQVLKAPAENGEKIRLTLTHLIQSLRITLLKIRNKNRALTPHFNIYVDGMSTTNEELWINLHTYLANREYILPLQGKAKVIKAPFNCGACHGVDHPRGLCTFPQIKGWNGPLNRAEDDPCYRGRPYGRFA